VTPFILFGLIRMTVVLVSLVLLIFLAVVGWRWMKAHESIAHSLSVWTGKKGNEQHRWDHG